MTPEKTVSEKIKTNKSNMLSVIKKLIEITDNLPGKKWEIAGKSHSTKAIWIVNIICYRRFLQKSPFPLIVILSVAKNAEILFELD